MTAEHAAANVRTNDWQALPVRARRLFMLHGLWLALPFTASAWGFSQATGMTVPWAWPLLAAVLGAAAGAWLGRRRWRHTRWRLDADGFCLRRGRMWQADTRVPQSRVQHLDLKRGPLQRRLRLATLVIHTAGTRHSAIELAGLDIADAERLRDHLAQQIDDDDADA